MKRHHLWRSGLLFVVAHLLLPDCCYPTHRQGFAFKAYKKWL